MEAGGEVEQTETPAEESASSPTSSVDLQALAGRIIEKIGTLETGKDVTSWAEFRLLDEYIAGKSFTDSGALFKTRAAKALVRAVWDGASRRASGRQVTAGDVRATFDPTSVAGWSGDGQDLQKFAMNLGLKNFHDYRNTSEHWRLLLSITQDEIYAGETPLKKPTGEALKLLAESATHLSLELLRRSSAVAKAEKSDRIGPKAVKTAFEEIRNDQQLENRPRRKPEEPEVVAREELQPLTGQLLATKIQAIESYHEKSDALEALNEAREHPVSAEAFELLKEKCLTLVRRATAGREIRRTDTFVGKMPGPTYGEGGPQRYYLVGVWIRNAIYQIFPYRVLPNGDVKLRFELSPAMPSTLGQVAPMTARPSVGRDSESEQGLPDFHAKRLPPVDMSEAEPFTARLLGHRLSAVRDSGIHWELLEAVHRQEPFATDAFGAEYLAEMVAVAATLYLDKATEHAAEREGEQVEPRDVRMLRRLDVYTMVLPEENDREWDAEKRRAKRELLDDYPDDLFERATEASGLVTELSRKERLEFGFRRRFNIADAMGSGLAVGDVNGDGYPDLYLPGVGLGQLYVNGGEEAPGRFAERTDDWKLPTDLADTRGALFFDMEGDGDDDLLILRSKSPSMLWRNEGSSFVEVTEEVGLKAGRGSSVASIFDYDEDGDLDIYIGFYGRDEYNRKSVEYLNIPTESGRNGTANQLYRRESDGTYTEVAEEAGLDDVGWALAMQTFDYDNDGHQDVAIANDFGANRLFRNRGDGTFADVTDRTHTGDRGSGMNISTSDVDGDGWWDFFLTNIDMFSGNIKNVFPTDRTLVDIDESIQHSFQYLTGNKLYLNREGPDGERVFQAEERQRFEPGDQGWAWDGNFFDYENDGDEDLYVANGFIADSYAADQENKMYLVEEGTFYDVVSESPETYPGNSRSVASLDADRDGDMDLLANDFRSPPVYLENTQSFDNHWLQVQLRGREGNSRAVGARVVVEAGDERQMRVETVGRGYKSQDDIALHFGVGEAETVDAIVRWPWGAKQRFEGLAVDQRHELQPR